ncbi:YHS domain-containing (seleno)protein [Runella aurantiaca]|uniref:YHS domain protein n=1 Tax=Runella aurantiaca TaxID=2282308 RepID=A0A369HZL3_9BACT|nr:YHS domain-containing (seleno)protein [Runella aurantiaca]RDB02939.1 YHS domain protein [Runella aurantiaca]
MKKLAGSIIVLLVVSIHLQAQKSEIFVKDSVAVRGYDVVAYFTQSAPVKGDSEFVYVWKGGKWYFANRENQEAFKASPEKYAPQYGGYCAYGTADGHKAPTDPDAWTVSDGKLYLNYNKKVMENWRKDQANFIDKANKNWPTVKLQE